MKPSRLFFGTLFYDPNGLYRVVLKDQLQLKSQDATVTGSIEFDAERYISGTVQADNASIIGTVQDGEYLSGTLQAQLSDMIGAVTITSSGPVTLGRVVITVT